MITLWVSIFCLLLLAISFFVWPMYRYKKTSLQQSVLSDAELNQRLAENVRLFREHLGELEKSAANESITSEQYNQLKLELERNLLDDEASLRAVKKSSSVLLGSKSVAVFTLLLCVAAVGLYHKYGSAPDVAIHLLQQEKRSQDYQDMLQNRASNPARAEQLIAEYKARLIDKPESAEYWFLLARVSVEAGKYAEAVDAYRQVFKRDAQEPMIMAEMAQAIFLANGNKMNAEIVELAQKAIALDSKNTMALGLLGIHAFAQKNYPEAIRSWQKIVDILGAEADASQPLVSGIEHATNLFLAAGGNVEDLLPKAAHVIRVSVSLGAGVKVAPDQTVFVYARTWQGSPMPLAISRIKVSELPKVIQLDETMAMSPTASLANASEVEVVARVSMDGSVQAKAGDWQVKQGPISMKTPSGLLELQIKEQVQ